MTEEARIFLDEYIAPRAADLDSGPEALRAALDEAAARGLLGLRAPTEFGGEGWSDERFREYQEHCARRSGAWAFLQTQHQSACSFVAKSPNESLRAEALPALASGKMRAGIAFAQLRRRGWVRPGWHGSLVHRVGAFRFVRVRRRVAGSVVGVGAR
ncbi:MAG: hypothetical protein DCC45_06945 [Armatimonadetes bacterium]|nr:MAG: hypothetical protein DCC45_06945 [Armatimonadota bacterium]